MKILHVIASVHKQGGGTSEVVPRICRAQKDAGNEVSLIALKADEISLQAESAMKAGVEFTFVDRTVNLPVIRNIGYASEFGSIVEDHISQADIIHIHGLWMYPLWAAAKAARRLAKPYVVMPHGFLEPERLKISKWKKRVSAAFFDRGMLYGAKAIIATSESEAQGIRAFGVSNRIYIMPLGLDVDEFAVTPRVNNGERKILLYFSRFTPIKGLDMLAEVWGKLCLKFPDWELRMVGPDDRGYVKEVIRMFGERCIDGSYSVDGPVFGNAKMKMLRSADAFVLPTRSENWSIAVAEAMASGLPVVCTKGAPWSCLKEIGAGVWVDISVEGIYNGLCKIMSATDEERLSMGSQGQIWVRNNLGWKKIAEQSIAQYKTLIG